MVSRPLHRADIPEVFAGRFWEKVHQIPFHSCWEWGGYREPDGYGQIIMGSRRRGRKQLAHRIAFALANGPIPADSLVCHRCDNRGCVRPEHLFLGTPQDNISDFVSKGRHLRLRSEPVAPRERMASGNGMRRLTWAQVREIRARYQRGETQREIASLYGISRQHVQRIVRLKVWPGTGPVEL